MASKVTNGKTLRGNWKRGVAIVASGVFIMGACIALRNYAGPPDVNASAREDASSPPPRNEGTSQASNAAMIAPEGEESATSSSHPDTMASVNGEKISRQELAEQCLRRHGQDVLESMVNKHLIWQACQEKEVAITDEDVTAEIKRMAEKFGLTTSRWLTMLHQERDITPRQYRDEIVWPKLALEALAAEQIVCTPQEVQEALEAEYGPRVKARAIIVDSREQAEQLREQAIKAPDTFAALAKQHSEDPSASVHGLIPPIRKHVGDEKIERTAFALQEGEISPVLEVVDQFMILKCEKQMPETHIANRFREDAEARLRDRLKDQKLRKVSRSLFQQLQDDAEIVNVINDPELSERMPEVAATINGQKISIKKLSEKCIEQHGEEVLEGEISRKLLQQALREESQQVTEEDLDAEIARSAEAYGHVKSDDSPDVEKWMREVADQSGASPEFYIRDVVWPTVALKKLVSAGVEVTEEDIKKGFESNYGPRVEALAIVLDNQRQAQKVWEMARGNPTDEFFGQLAQQYSTDSVSRENFGRIPPIRRHGGRPELESEAFSLSPGELSGIMVSNKRYVILRCTGHTTPVVRSLDEEVRKELVKDLREKKLRLAMSEQFEQLQDDAAIENYLIGSLQSPRKEQDSGAGDSQAPASLSRRPTAAERR